MLWAHVQSKCLRQFLTVHWLTTVRVVQQVRWLRLSSFLDVTDCIQQAGKGSKVNVRFSVGEPLGHSRVDRIGRWRVEQFLELVRVETSLWYNPDIWRSPQQSWTDTAADTAARSPSFALKLCRHDPMLCSSILAMRYFNTAWRFPYDAQLLTRADTGTDFRCCKPHRHGASGIVDRSTRQAAWTNVGYQYDWKTSSASWCLPSSLGGLPYRVLHC